jgi:hypothetical protein
MLCLPAYLTRRYRLRLGRLLVPSRSTLRLAREIQVLEAEVASPKQVEGHPVAVAVVEAAVMRLGRALPAAALASLSSSAPPEILVSVLHFENSTYLTSAISPLTSF